MSEKIFIGGMRFDLPSEKAPDFVKGKISIKVSDFIEFAEKNQTTSGWINIDLKVGKSGRGYAELNTWKPQQQKEKEEEINEINADLPF